MEISRDSCQKNGEIHWSKGERKDNWRDYLSREIADFLMLLIRGKHKYDEEDREIQEEGEIQIST